ncbi:MAG: hypothetical protein M1819_006629 [Sarea resinae]|nr:MAG: hypothetical protein M1819_006629 [Sarea resinae]
MSASNMPHQEEPPEDEGDVMLDPAEAGEEIPEDEDFPMGSDGEDEEEDPSATLEEIQLQNDSVAHFDAHKDSIFCIAQHPIHPEIVATGAGDDTAYIFDATPPETPVLPASYQSAPSTQPQERDSLRAIYKCEGHTDSVNAITFTLPRGEYVLTAGLDGRLRAYKDASSSLNGQNWTFLSTVQEVEEINWLIPCPHPSYPNTIALGANDGSVWIYTVNAADTASPLTIVQAFYLHTESCTAGAWSPDGKLLATVSEDSSLYVWDVFSEAAAAGLTQTEGSSGGQTVVGLTAADQRFAVEGGLYSVAISPTGTFVVVGGAEGGIRVIGLPRIGALTSSSTGARGSGAASKSAGGKRSGGPNNLSTSSSPSAGQAGTILAALQSQSDGIETLSFSSPPLTLLAAGSVDGSITLFDTAHRFAVRRHIKDAHEEFAVVKVDFVRPAGGAQAQAQAQAPAAGAATASSSASGGWLLTSCGMDGVVRRWDTRGGTAAAGQGLVGEWRGHRGDGEGGGVLGFVQGGRGGRDIVTAGDDGVSLVFDASSTA